MRLAAAVAVLGMISPWLGATPPQQQTDEVVTALHAGEKVTLHLHRAKGGTLVKVGPWRLGTKVKKPEVGRSDRISDRRINLYFVVPGSEYRQASAPEFDHNLIENKTPDENVAIDTDADLFWVAVLDPKVSQEIRLENEMIMLAQERFMPNDLFALDDAPSAELLRDQLGFDSLRELAPFRNEDGTLPRVLILPAKVIVRVTIEPNPPEPAPTQPQ
jgi:hypothetical protein